MLLQAIFSHHCCKETKTETKQLKLYAKDASNISKHINLYGNLCT